MYSAGAYSEGGASVWEGGWGDKEYATDGQTERQTFKMIDRHYLPALA
jgi:hypothetical protein